MSNEPLDSLVSSVVDRDVSLFASDMESAAGELTDSIKGSRILVIGGAGSIGSSTIRTIAGFAPATIDVIDHNENGLAELIRSLRSGDELSSSTSVHTLPFSLGGDPFRLWLTGASHTYDHVLNFAALKHVRSEKDPFSILAMLETNVLRLDELSGFVAGHRPRRVFSVSTDKAANPSSMMGATKRLMEHALFGPTHPWAPGTSVSSARFANVAFSNGSLLQSWEMRLAAGHPLACPIDTRRFFVSMAESGHLCTLVGFLGEHRTVAVPALHPSEHLVLLSDIVVRFLHHHGYEAHLTQDESEALGRVGELRAAGRWPVLMTPLDTAGEKPYEEFVGEQETVGDSRFGALRQLDYLPPAREGSFEDLVATLRSLLEGTDPAGITADRLKGLIASVEPAFADSHRSSTELLDNRI